MGIGGAVQREGARDDWRNAAGTQFADQHVHRRRELPPLVPQVADVQPEHAAVPVDERQRVESGRRVPRLGCAQEVAAFARLNNQGLLEYLGTYLKVLRGTPLPLQGGKPNAKTIGDVVQRLKRFFASCGCKPAMMPRT